MDFDNYSILPPEEKTDVYRINFIDKNSWEEWPEELHNDLPQVKSQEKALSKRADPDYIDKQNKSGVFSGSGKSPYTVDLSSCTCGDFKRKKKPCKHMYRLAYEVEVIKLYEAEAGYRNIIIMRSIQNSCKNLNSQWGGWDKKIHKIENQKHRIYRALTEDYNKCYQTTLENCSCPDFQERKFPCKHIYALRFAQENNIEGLTKKDVPEKYIEHCHKDKNYDEFRNVECDSYVINPTSNSKTQIEFQSSGCFLKSFLFVITIIFYILI